MKEFVVLMAFLMALIALSIDAILPALGFISEDLSITRANDVQYVVSSVFLGMALGTIIYGPLSDAWGRKPALLTGLILFTIGGVIAYLADNLTVMLIGRFIQGLGAGSPRVLTSAIVRDKFHGRQMASMMSMIMGVFILVPALAPTIGQAIMYISDWHGIFILYICAGLLAIFWQHFRLEETLPTERRRPLQIAKLLAGFKEAATTRVTFGYTICSGVIFASLICYITSAQQIFHEIFEVGDMFAIYFGAIALAIGAAFFTNAKLVERFGMRKITAAALLCASIGAGILFIHTMLAPPSLLVFMLCASIIFFCLGLTFGNMNAMAMEPMGHIAGLASAFLGAVSSVISLTLGSTLGQMYDGTLIPLASGFFIFGLISLLVMFWTEKGIPREQPENMTSHS